MIYYNERKLSSQETQTYYIGLLYNIRIAVRNKRT